ncbi:DUF6463 family protein [Paenibacillus sp. GYB003]|uniref:DUF6463 family protein n=1 Tax=Paenibacillus sp. GYB003 TaxID=2994392 RepID=UPI002F966029
MKPDKIIGGTLAWTAVLHTVVGLFLYWEPIKDMAKVGLFNSVVPHSDRGSAFWFFIFGAMLWTFSRVVGWFARAGQRVPTFLGVHLMALCLVGVFFVPLSGFWLGIPQAAVLLRRNAGGRLLNSP